MVITWTYQVLISCPGDVHAKFGSIIQDAVNEYNKRISSMQKSFVRMHGHRVAIEVLYWRESSRAVFLTGESGQDVLNDQIVYPADGTIGLFYTRLGTPTEHYESGTVEELEKSLEQGKPVAVIPIVTEDLPRKLIGDGREFSRLNDYIDSLKNGKRGLIIDCSPENLKDAIMNQFDEIVYKCEENRNKYKDISLTESG